MNIENAKAQMRKGILEYCILSILAKQNDLIVVEGTLYPLLTRQKNAGLLKYRWEESTQGPPRKYYTLTDMGRSYLKELDESWDSLISSVKSIKNFK